MWKAMCKRMVHSFCYAIAIVTVFYYAIIQWSGKLPLLPEYAQRFDNDVMAVLVQMLLIGIMSAVLAGGTIIMELERLSLLVQSILYFIISITVWVLVARYCWGFGKYIQSAVSLILSYSISYSICWIIQYKTCRKNINEINQTLEKLGQTE